MRISCIFLLYFPSLLDRKRLSSHLLLFNEGFDRDCSRALPIFRRCSLHNKTAVNVNSVDLNPTIHGWQVENAVSAKAARFNFDSRRRENVEYRYDDI